MCPETIENPLPFPLPCWPEFILFFVLRTVCMHLLGLWAAIKHKIRREQECLLSHPDPMLWIFWKKCQGQWSYIPSYCISGFQRRRLALLRYDWLLYQIQSVPEYDVQYPRPSLRHRMIVFSLLKMNQMFGLSVLKNNPWALMWKRE